MREATACALLVATLAVTGCRETTVGPDGELAAPANQFVVMTRAGTQLTGPAARIDIRHVDAAKPPDVEIAFSASVASARAPRPCRFASTREKALPRWRDCFPFACTRGGSRVRPVEWTTSSPRGSRARSSSRAPFLQDQQERRRRRVRRTRNRP